MNARTIDIAAGPALPVKEGTTVLLWSQSQNCFHIEPFTWMVESNAKAFAYNRPVDYVTLWMGTEDDCDKIAEVLRPKMQERDEARRAEPAAPAVVDVEQIIFALGRARDRLQHEADLLCDALDYSAEFPSEDAARMREAIELLRPMVTDAGASQVERSPSVPPNENDTRDAAHTAVVASTQREIKLATRSIWKLWRRLKAVEKALLGQPMKTQPQAGAE